LKKKVEKVVEEKYEQWTGEMKPTQVYMDASSIINVTFAEMMKMLTTAGVTSKSIKGSKLIISCRKRSLAYFLRRGFDAFNCVIKFVFSLGYYFGNEIRRSCCNYIFSHYDFLELK